MLEQIGDLIAFAVVFFGGFLVIAIPKMVKTVQADEVTWIDVFTTRLGFLLSLAAMMVYIFGDQASWPLLVVTAVLFLPMLLGEIFKRITPETPGKVLNFLKRLAVAVVHGLKTAFSRR